jgi:aerobic-type carbon monoxide dehydrogenase small subunit (CoxS/CutS family)
MAKSNPGMERARSARSAVRAPGETGGGTRKTSIMINGTASELELDPRTTLLDALREHLHLTGTKKGCDHGQCGACTVLINGRRMNSCLTLAVMHEGDDVVTIEGIGGPGALHPMQAAFVEHDGFQCGYCTPGQICSAIGMLSEARAGWHEFALISVATILAVEGSTIASARVAFGGVAHKPWRSLEAEAVLHGRPATLETYRAAADAALARAVGRGPNDFKIELAKRTLIATLVNAAGGRP